MKVTKGWARTRKGNICLDGIADGRYELRDTIRRFPACLRPDYILRVYRRVIRDGYYTLLSDGCRVSTACAGQFHAYFGGRSQVPRTLYLYRVGS